MSKIKEIYLDACMCGIFRSVLDQQIFRYFSDYVRADRTDDKIIAYSSIVSVIYENGGSLTDTVINALFCDENVYIKARAHKEKVSRCVNEALVHELSAFQRLASLTPDDFMEDMGVGYVLPFESDCRDFSWEYEKRIADISKHGYGIFSANPMFRLEDNGCLSPIASADKTTLSDFVGYSAERESVINNTRAFVEGRPAANVLLYGDAGTGKSSTVKAVVNAFYSEGIRLIELRKDQLSSLPYIMGRISENPLKFIIFIDDLSFEKNDDNFSMLKAALEGSASAKADNAVIYATSNRRHIVRECFDDRDGGDVHRNDTMQQKLSLSERFGLTVLFAKPDKKLYLQIVHELAERYGIACDTQLDVRAEEFALRRGNRSARCAEHFIKSLL